VIVVFLALFTMKAVRTHRVQGRRRSQLSMWRVRGRLRSQLSNWRFPNPRGRRLRSQLSKWRFPNLQGRRRRISHSRMWNNNKSMITNTMNAYNFVGTNFRGLGKKDISWDS
jgi:hypothetical protein